MKLFLASYVMTTINKIIKYINEDLTGEKVIFVPTAGDPYENKDFVYADRNALKEYGLKIVDLDIKNSTLSKIKEEIFSAKIVLVAGGDTFYLMEKLKESGADKVIKKYIEKDGIYIGSSAGSIVCCPTIQGAEEFDNPRLAPNLKNFDGMDIFSGVIIPHAHKEKYFERIKAATSKLELRGYKVFSLTDNDVLFYNGEKLRIL